MQSVLVPSSGTRRPGMVGRRLLCWFFPAGVGVRPTEVDLRSFRLSVQIIDQDQHRTGRAERVDQVPQPLGRDPRVPRGTAGDVDIADTELAEKIERLAVSRFLPVCLKDVKARRPSGDLTQQRGLAHPWLSQHAQDRGLSAACRPERRRDRAELVVLPEHARASLHAEGYCGVMTRR